MKTMAISVGARKRRSTKPSRTPFPRPIRFQSSSRRRVGAPVVPDLKTQKMPVPSQNFIHHLVGEGVLEHVCEFGKEALLVDQLDRLQVAQQLLGPTPSLCD